MENNLKVETALIALTRHLKDNSIAYEDAANLCLFIYCENVRIGEVSIDLKMEEISFIFSSISSSGLVVDFDSSVAVYFGANYHDFKTQGHWTEIMASIFKLGRSYDRERAIRLWGLVSPGPD